MTTQQIRGLEAYPNGFQPSIPKFRQGKFIQIVVLRETKSHAVFTTEGTTLDVEHLQAGITTTTPIDRIVMYKRKQIAPERRTGKSLMRQYGIVPEENVKDKRYAATKGVRKGGCIYCF